MKEMTRVITAEITIIESMPDEDADAMLQHKDDAVGTLHEFLKKNFFNADDVHAEIQDFVRDL